MITLTISVPDNNAILAAGLAKIRGKRHPSMPTAPGVSVVPDILLVQNQTSYTLVDAQGAYTDWYGTVYVDGGGNESVESAAQPAYLSDLSNTIRKLLGVTTVELADADLQGFTYLPAAFGVCRQRLSTFDAVVAAGGDLSAKALAAVANLTASMLCDAMKVLVVDAEQIKDYRYQRNRAMDWDATRDSFMKNYQRLIGQAAGDDVTTGVYVSPLKLAGPTRAGYDTTGGLVAVDGSNGAFANPLNPYDPNLR